MDRGNLGLDVCGVCVHEYIYICVCMCACGCVCICVYWLCCLLSTIAMVYRRQTFGGGFEHRCEQATPVIVSTRDCSLNHERWGESDRSSVIFRDFPSCLLDRIWQFQIVYINTQSCCKAAVVSDLYTRICSCSCIYQRPRGVQSQNE